MAHAIPAGGLTTNQRSITLFFGPPGAGKGEEGRKFAKDTDAVFFSMGDSCRARLVSDRVFRQAITAFKQEHGSERLFPNELVTPVFDLFFRTVYLSQHRDIVLDGFPRNMLQFNYFLKLLQDHQIPFEIVRAVWLNVHEDVLWHRLLTASSTKPRRPDEKLDPVALRDYFEGRMQVYTEDTGAMILEAKSTFPFVEVKVETRHVTSEQVGRLLRQKLKAIRRLPSASQPRLNGSIEHHALSPRGRVTA